jgi:hypothetical protein
VVPELNACFAALELNKMNSVSTAREALIAEALGEVGALIDRVEALVPAVDDPGQTAWRAYENLIDRINRFENQVLLLAAPWNGAWVNPCPW